MHSEPLLNTVRQGPEGSEATPLLIAHGLFGSARNWNAIAKRLSGTRPVLTVDMRNHGHSFRADRQGYDDMAGDLARVIEAQGGQADVLGHSMGGKAAMVLALQHPQLVRRLIVADIAPVGYGHSQTPLIEAMQAVDLARVKSRRDADAQLRACISEDPVRAFLLQSLDLTGDHPRWRLNLPVLAAEMDRIIGFPDIGGRFDGPALFLTGAASDYVRPEHLPRIRELFPDARIQELPDAGHWLHADNPRGFEAAVRAFLDG